MVINLLGKLLFEKEVNKFVSSKVRNLNIELRDKMSFYFCNKMTEHYNKEEKKLKNIIYTYVHSVNKNLKAHLNIYYRNLKSKTYS